MQMRGQILSLFKMLAVLFTLDNFCINLPFSNNTLHCYVFSWHFLKFLSRRQAPQQPCVHLGAVLG